MFNSSALLSFRVVGPNFLWEQANSGNSSSSSLNAMVKINSVAELLISQVHKLFEPPVSSLGIWTLPQVLLSFEMISDQALNHNL